MPPSPLEARYTPKAAQCLAFAVKENVFFVVFSTNVNGEREGGGVNA